MRIYNQMMKCISKLPLSISFSNLLIQCFRNEIVHYNGKIYYKYINSCIHNIQNIYKMEMNRIKAIIKDS
ncbi:hypothetical protein ENUP19_0118G0001 [Entamoeba nuttalli]|uniref:Uncharacterized protein n=1 Tax=Entamoeba nuttalli TaxID=412467 RepID=A0ABQ0DI95_9EUKA